jgi:tetratricopeptide (TPR) repeat protein
MKPLVYLFFLFLTGAALLGSRAYGSAATEYDNAGLQLYNSHVYDQAQEYYELALQSDPQDPAALMGSGNCHYALGQYADALADYRKLQALQPGNTQLSAFVQSLQARMGAAPAATPTLLQQGVALYNQKQFAASIPYFQQCIQMNPKEADAYQYLGLAQVQCGHFKEGAVALDQYNYLHPDPPVAYYAYQLRGRLMPADQLWVDAQLSAAGMAPGAVVAGSVIAKPFGGYLEPAFDLVHLSDFEIDAKTWQKATQQLQLSDPTFGFTGSVPEGGLRAGLEPVLKLTKNLQIGIPFSFFPVGTASDSVSNQSGSESHVESSLISALSIGFSLKYLIFTGGFEPFISVAPFMEPIGIDYSSTDTASGTTTKVSGSYSGTSVGALFKAGADLHLDDTFVITPFFAYNFASPTQFTGNAAYVNSPQPNGHGTLEMAPNPINGQESITVLPDGATPPPNSRPLGMDLSGLEGGISFGAFF